MKKLLLGLVLSFSISTLFACHVDTTGWCGGKAFFKTGAFNNHSEFQFRLYGTDDVLFSYYTRDEGNTDSVFTLPQEIQNYPLRIQFRHRDKDSNVFTEWSGNYDIAGGYIQSATNQLSSCNVLAVNFSNVSALKTSSGTKVNFTNNDESEVLSYNIMMSHDSKTWEKVRSIKSTGQHEYSINLGTISISFIIPFLVFFKSKRIRPLLYLLILMVAVLFSCQKENLNIQNTDKYSFVKIDAIKVDGSIVSSEIKSF